MVFCIQCAMKALADGVAQPDFGEETIHEHMRKHHPDPVATADERLIIQQRLMERTPGDAPGAVGAEGR